MTPSSSSDPSAAIAAIGSAAACSSVTPSGYGPAVLPSRRSDGCVLGVMRRASAPCRGYGRRVEIAFSLRNAFEDTREVNSHDKRKC